MYCDVRANATTTCNVDPTVFITTLREVCPMLLDHSYIIIICAPQGEAAEPDHESEETMVCCLTHFTYKYLLKH